MHKYASRYIMKRYKVILTESEMRKLNEVRRDVRSKRLVADDYDMEDDNGFITVDHIDKNNYKKYIGKKVNVTGSVFLNYLNLGKLPITFGTVGGSFGCFHSHLTSLKGCPRKVGGFFSCAENDLTSLEGCPKEVGEYFLCCENRLTSLLGCPSKIDGDFDCSYNMLTSLEGCPRIVNGDFDCRYNKDEFTKAGVKRLCKVRGDILESTDMY